MALKAIISKEDHSKLSDSLKAEYKENKEKGHFVLDVTPTDGWALEDVSGLKHVLSTERTQHEAAKEKLKVFGDMDPTAAREALSKAEEIKKWTPDEKTKAIIAEKERALTEKHTKEVNDLKAENDGLTKGLRTHAIGSAAAAALARHKGNVDLLLPIIDRQTRVEKDPSGKWVVRVISDDGAVRITGKQGKTDPMDLDELVEGMKTDKRFMAAFEGSGSKGTGAGGEGGGGGGGGGTIDPNLSPTERIKAYREQQAAGTR